MHIAITGNIGAGKTTLAGLLAARYGWEVLYEAVEDNPYLADFYDDMTRWSFNLQIYFLNSRFAQIKAILAAKEASEATPEPPAGAGRRPPPRTLIQDRTIYEDAAIFARNLYQSGYMTGRDYETYQHLFETMMSLVQPPDLLIYLRADLPKLREQIQKRGRSFEKTISDAYLLNLNRLYEEFVGSYQKGPLLVVNVNPLNYAENPADFDAIAQQIDQRLAESAPNRSAQNRGTRL